MLSAGLRGETKPSTYFLVLQLAHVSSRSQDMYLAVTYTYTRPLPAA